MTVELPDELRSAVSAHPGEPLELVDEQTRRAYVLVPAEEFQRLKTVAELVAVNFSVPGRSKDDSEGFQYATDGLMKRQDLISHFGSQEGESHDQ